MATSSGQAASSSSGTGKKRTSDQAGIIDILSSDDDDNDDISALDPAERAAFIRMKACISCDYFSVLRAYCQFFPGRGYLVQGKLAQARVKKEKKAKHEPQSTFTPGEVIDLSD